MVLIIVDAKKLLHLDAIEGPGKNEPCHAPFGIRFEGWSFSVQGACGGRSITPCWTAQGAERSKQQKLAEILTTSTKVSCGKEKIVDQDLKYRTRYQ